MHRVRIGVLDPELDAQAVRRGTDITAYLSYETPLWVREATVAHLIRALGAVEGNATVHLERGQSVLVALDTARAQPRARPRLPIHPLVSITLALIAAPFIGGILLLRPWVTDTATVTTSETPTTPPECTTTPTAPTPPPARRPETTPPTRPRRAEVTGKAIPALPRLPAPPIPRNLPRYLPEGTDPFDISTRFPWP